VGKKKKGKRSSSAESRVKRLKGNFRKKKRTGVRACVRRFYREDKKTRFCRVWFGGKLRRRMQQRKVKSCQSACS
jgi:hypothetical protein